MDTSPIPASTNARLSLSCSHFLFAGPTLYGRNSTPIPLPPEVQVSPPAKRGDIAQLVASRHAPGTIILVDGIFFPSQSVSPSELRQALQAGWRVWGLSALGAMRACELESEGMQGFGAIYEHFHQDGCQEDEVTRLYMPEPPYQALSEPLIHLRAALQKWQDDGWLLEEQRNKLEGELRTLWYGDRTLERFAKMVSPSLTSKAQAAVKKDFAAFDRYRLQTQDLERFIAHSWATPPNPRSSKVSHPPRLARKPERTRVPVPSVPGVENTRQESTSVLRTHPSANFPTP